MQNSGINGICVIIAAMNASDTIARAVASALREPEVAEVFVIDDASSDNTLEIAKSADDGSGRLKTVRLDHNQGPAAARNHAIRASTSPFISILDADDFFLPGRFAALMNETGWDFIADNIAFIGPRNVSAVHHHLEHFEPRPRLLDLVGFVEGNIPSKGVKRGEIGFLKPVFRRRFLEEHGLLYNETLRLGEDYDLYARALAKGARFKIIHSCGYAAVVRSDSLSGAHRTGDLRKLYEADTALLRADGLPDEAVASLRRHRRHVDARYQLRLFLDIKAEAGLAAAFFHLAARPAIAPAVISGIIADKMARFRPAPKPSPDESPMPRYLLKATPTV